MKIKETRKMEKVKEGRREVKVKETMMGKELHVER